MSKEYVVPGTFYVVATPIGNLEDITLRALHVLRQATVIYAEDTRVTHKLTARFGIETPVRSYREAAPPVQVARMVQEVLSHLERGEVVAYVSDAGTPGVSDPGNYLVQQVEDSGFPTVPVPGASALTTILSVAGLPVQRPFFAGFLPKKKGRQTLLRELRHVLEKGLCDSIVFYESPERILRLLVELLEWKLELKLCLGRELTKQYEEILRGSVQELIHELEKRPRIRGEIVLLVTYSQ